MISRQEAVAKAVEYARAADGGFVQKHDMAQTVELREMANMWANIASVLPDDPSIGIY